MAKKTVRSYYSLVRQRQADETRARIATAARQLILNEGYEAATIEAIAREAGVATPTVYAVFGSKRRILTELIDRAAFGPAYQDLIGEVEGLVDPVARLRFAARIARHIYDSERSEFDLLRKAGVVIPELAAIEREKECGRYEAQAPTITLLIQAGRLLPGLGEKEARDILWTLTGRDIYRMLVIERKWSSDRYEKWLSDAIVGELVLKKRAGG
ncbi:TetR/AcrR family transcriptional regulator [Pedosphaera parvula]|uniref:Transcriptional regulator, TetR family n=1 Tax=Pedosphaera parvula (strain Ellin514) TaxID=320771 RepID=B9XD94_PEDPL|nr:TetR/AcrR family transcriptional regulator [Pedosphaera parvula]EEF62040.1 transcriptional regulator, TetR family [Pedosphaera parvula Ellin514]